MDIINPHALSKAKTNTMGPWYGLKWFHLEKLDSSPLTSKMFDTIAEILTVLFFWF